MPACHPVHHIHYLLVLVVGQIHLPIDRSKLKLVRSNFLVPGFQRNAEFVSFHLQFFHKCGDTRRNSAEIVVVQLLVLAGFVSHQRASGNHQIRAGGIDILIYKEILLLPSEIGTYMLYGRIEEAADRQSGISYSLQGALQRSLEVQCFACICNEYRGYTERIVLNEYGRRRIPCGIAACLECCAYTSARKARCVRFLLHETSACKSLYHSPFAVVVDKGVVLLGSAVCERLEPVGDMRHIVLQRPFLHAGGHLVSYSQVERKPFVDAVYKSIIGLGFKITTHLLAGEHKLAEVAGDFAFRHRDVRSLFFEGFQDNCISQVGHTRGCSLIVHVSFRVRLSCAPRPSEWMHCSPWSP